MGVISAIPCKKPHILRQCLKRKFILVKLAYPQRLLLLLEWNILEIAFVVRFSKRWFSFHEVVMVVCLAQKHRNRPTGFRAFWCSDVGFPREGFAKGREWRVRRRGRALNPARYPLPTAIHLSPCCPLGTIHDRGRSWQTFSMCASHFLCKFVFFRGGTREG